MPLDVFQQVFSLSLVSNLVNGLKGTQTDLQIALQLGLTFALPVIGDQWEVVWGPVVWKNQPDEATTGPDNSWYVAYHPSLQFEDGSVRPTYVIAIAGTPLEAEYVWIKENFAVNSVSDFTAWVAGGIQNPPVIVPAKSIVPGVPYIATGTVNTVHLLLTRPAPPGAASAGTTLLDFITKLDQSASPRLITTGHSLGGTLSPSLALALVSAGLISADATLTYPSAGASPGNSGFTDLFSQTFPPRKSADASSYQGWNLNLVNTLDIVPQAWCPLKPLSPPQNLANIPPIYGTPVLPIVRGATIVFAVHALSSGALYKPLPSQYFTASPPSVPPTSLEEFLQVLGPQHQLAYFNEVGITVPTLNESQVLGAGLSEKSKDEIRFNYPVIAELEWAREHPKEAQKVIEGAEDTPEAQDYLAESG
ncbi:hypothetical protein J3R82DRAFT_8260 [Butyriboletus roseoflavus]|nr:hypothetical protein J3R82DRAFT_8260 [Butyriboletus roseoflavus]